MKVAGLLVLQVLAWPLEVRYPMGSGRAGAGENGTSFMAAHLGTERLVRVRAHPR